MTSFSLEWLEGPERPLLSSCIGQLQRGRVKWIQFCHSWLQPDYITLFLCQSNMGVKKWHGILFRYIAASCPPWSSSRIWVYSYVSYLKLQRSCKWYFFLLLFSTPHFQFTACGIYKSESEEEALWPNNPTLGLLSQTPTSSWLLVSDHFIHSWVSHEVTCHWQAKWEAACPPQRQLSLCSLDFLGEQGKTKLEMKRGEDKLPTSKCSMCRAYYPVDIRPSQDNLVTVLLW